MEEGSSWLTHVAMENGFMHSDEERLWNSNWHIRACETLFRVDSWPPVAVSVVRTEGKTGSGFAMPVDLFRKPLKPFPIFLRTCALTFVFDVAVQFAPGHADCAAQQFVDYVQRNHSRKHGIPKRFENASYGLDCLKETRIGFDLCWGCSVGNCLHKGHRFDPSRPQDCLDSYERSAFLSLPARASHFNQPENHSRQHGESCCNVCKCRKIHRTNLLKRIV